MTKLHLVPVKVDINMAMAKLEEYARCGLAHNGRDLKQLKDWLSVVKEAIELKSCPNLYDGLCEITGEDVWSDE